MSIGGSDFLIGVDVVANLEGLRKQLADVVDPNTARAMTAEIHKAIKAQERAVKASSKAMGSAQKESAGIAVAAAAAMGDVGDAAVMSAGAMKQGRMVITQNLLNVGQTAIATRGNLVSMVSVLPDLIYGFNMLGLTLKMLLPKMGAVGTVLAAVGGAYALLSSRAEKARLQQELFREATEKLRPALEAWDDALIEAGTNLGWFSEQDVKVQRLRRVADKEYEDATEAIKGRVAELEKEHKIEGTRSMALAERIAQLKAQKDVFVQERVELGKLDIRETEANLTRENRIGLAERIAATEVVADERRKKQQATERAGEDIARKAAAAQRELLAAYEALGDDAPTREFEQAVAQIREWEASITRARRMTPDLSAALNALESEAVRTLESSLYDLAEAQDAATQAQVKAAREADAGRLDAAQRAQRQIDDLLLQTYGDEEQAIRRVEMQRKDAYAQAIDASAELGMGTEQLIGVLDRLGEHYDGLAEKAGRSYQDQTAMALRYGEVAAGIATGIADAAIDAKRREVEGGKASAKELFETEKAAGIARALIAGAVASAQVWASYIGQGWQTALGYQLAVAAETTAAVAVVAAQQAPVAHQGMAPDEFSATLRQGEGVLNPNAVAAVGGPDAVKRLNSEGPAAAAGQQVIYATVLDGRVVSAIAAKEIRKRGGPLGDLDRAARGKVGYHNHYAGSRGVL